MKLLVTGGSGFIGSNFITYRLRNYENDEVINLDIMSYASNPLTCERAAITFGSRYRLVEGDICDVKLVDALVSECDAIVHFAAESHVDRSVEDPLSFARTNVQGTTNLLFAALKHGKKRFHHISTDEVFGTLSLNSSEKFTSTSPIDPRSPYSASKAGAEHMVRAFHETYGLPVTITNCTNNYGPYMFPEKVIPLFITRMMQDKPVPVYADGKAVRDYIHVEDHCRAIDMVLRKGEPGKTYLVGGDAERNTLEVARAVLAALGKEHQYDELVKHTKDRPGHDPRYAIDHSETTSLLGWKPQYTFEKGVASMVAWYQQNEEWWKPLMPQAERIAEMYLKNT